MAIQQNFYYLEADLQPPLSLLVERCNLFFNTVSLFDTLSKLMVPWLALKVKIRHHVKLKLDFIKEAMKSHFGLRIGPFTL